MANAQWRAAFEKMMALHAVEPRCTEFLRRLACSTNIDDPSYLQAVQTFESDLSGETIPDAASGVGTPGYEQCNSVLRLLRGSHRLLERLRAEPLLQTLPRTMVSTLLHLADLSPDPDQGLTSADASLGRILTYLTPGTVDTDAVLREGLSRLISLAREFPDAAKLLGRAARSTEWTAQMQDLEARLDPSLSGPLGSERSAPGEDLSALLGMVEKEEKDKPPPDNAPSALRHMLVRRPQFSTLTREEMLGFEEVRDEYADKKRPLFTSDAGDFSVQKQYTGAANDLMKPEDWDRRLKQMKSPELLTAIAKFRAEWTEKLELMKTGLNLRATIALHYSKLRGVAKLDTLERNWPDVYRVVKIDLFKMMAVEGRLNPPKPDATSIPEIPVDEELWKRCVQDDNLVRLLKLRPRLRDINQAEYARYQKLAKQSPSTVQPPPSGSLPVSAPPPSPGTPVIPPAPVSLAASSVPPLYNPIYLTIAPETVAGTYQVRLEYPNSTPVVSTVTPDLTALRTETEALGSVERGTLMTRELSAPKPGRQLNEVLRAIGQKLHDQFISTDVDAKLNELLSAPLKYRIFLQLEEPAMANLPWEALYLPSLGTAISLTTRTSLIRYYKPPAGSIPPSFSPPLNIVVIIPEPPDIPPLNGRQEKAILEATLSPSISQRLVKLTFLEGENANPDQLRHTIRRENPHVVQFVGHARYDSTQKKGQLILQKGSEHTLLESDDLSAMVRDTRVGLVILNGCDTGTSSSNDALSGVAAAVVAAGVSAAVATMRLVYDEAALRFTREFYRFFVEGYTLESSLIESRIALYHEDWNWSAYALFSSVEPNLDFLRLLVPPGRSAPANIPA
jgi:hypothetical protein